MKKIIGNIRFLTALIVFLFCSVVSSYGQPWNDVPNMVAGDLMFSYMSPFHSYFGTETRTTGIPYIRVGCNVGKDWSNPNGQYPAGYWITGYWVGIHSFFVYDSDTNFSPAKIGGANNPYASNSDGKFAVGNFHWKLDGAKDPNRTYVKAAKWVDSKRNHMVSEMGYVTNVGVDVKVRYHSFAAPNWNNLNDFIIAEYSFKNTGKVDLNHDGVFESTNHKITGLVFNGNDGGWNPHTSTYSGRRGSSWGTNDARCSGWIGDLDPNNEPWAFIVGFNGVATRYNTKATPPSTPANGIIDMGFAPYSYKYYSDIWQGLTIIAAKKGGLPADINKSTATQQDKDLIWGTPAIGKGAQRGWFLSGGSDKNFGWSNGNPKRTFLTTMGVFCKDGGVNASGTSLDYKPDPNFFASGEDSKIETWVPKKTSGFTASERPRGDRKSLSLVSTNPANAFFQIVEDGTKEGTTKYTPNTSAGYPAWGHMGAEGCVDYNNFDNTTYTGVGPFSLDVGEEITIVMVQAAGFRLEGFQKAIRAARWAYDQDLQIPTPPPVPNIDIRSTTVPTALIRWDNAAESDSKFAGYKIWKSSSSNKNSYLDGGMRLIDHYQEQMTVGADITPLKKPINPHFNAFGDVVKSSYKGLYPGDTWGQWELYKVIPKADVSKYVDASPVTGTKYVFEDVNVALGIRYWYYISAYSEGSFTGPGGETTTRIETHQTNLNGASGLWEGTYSYATAYTDKYPTTEEGKKNIGAPVSFFTKVAKESDLKSGALKIGVRPNPYKEIALHDNFLSTYDHKVLFYNLPAKCKITIVDVSGKVVQVLHFEETANETRGSMFWNLFSKDGQEVSSGLYIFYAEYEGGTETGKFSILR